MRGPSGGVLRRGLLISFLVSLGLVIVPAQGKAGFESSGDRGSRVAGGSQWTDQFGSSDDDWSGGVAADASGAYITGGTDGVLPGQEGSGGRDVFLRKYDTTGEVLWTRQFGTTSLDSGRAVVADSSGVYVTGHTVGVFEGQAGYGGSDGFVRKYDGEGEVLWTRQFGTSEDDQGYGVAADASGVYVAGHTNGVLPGQEGSGSRDVFVRKYDADGEVLWTRQFGTDSGDSFGRVAADATGVYVTGHTVGVFEGQAGYGGSDGFVRKYDGEGEVLWTRQFGTTDDEHMPQIAVDDSGVYVTGSILSGVPGEGNVKDVFLRKYGAGGDLAWERLIDTGADDHGGGVAVDASGVYVTGHTDGVFPGQADPGAKDVFVRKYDALGGVLWTRQLGTSGRDDSGGVAVDASGIYLTGHTKGQFPGQTRSGYLDVFTLKVGTGACKGWEVTIEGTEESDTLVGTPGDDVIDGKGGDDILLGKGGNDVICGGDGADFLAGGPGKDILWGQGGRDLLQGRAGNDVLFGGSHSDRLNGARGDDLVNGGNGNRNRLWGGPGGDRISGGPGDDLLMGGDDDDTLLAKNGDDILDGGDGIDILRGGRGTDTCTNGEILTECE